MATTSTQNIPLQEIQATDATQPREAMDPALINDYAEAMERGDVFPPIEAVFDGEHYWLTDGFHRFTAAEYIGAETITAIVNDGTRRDAEWQCLAANATHGKRRTRADKRRAIERALMDEEWRKKSNSEIARHLHVSDKTVGTHRARLEAASEIPKVTERQGADGKVYNTSNIGTNPAPKDEQANAPEGPTSQSREDLVSEATPKPSKPAQQATASSDEETQPELPLFGKRGRDSRDQIAILTEENNQLQALLEKVKRERGELAEKLEKSERQREKLTEKVAAFKAKKTSTASEKKIAKLTKQLEDARIELSVSESIADGLRETIDEERASHAATEEMLNLALERARFWMGRSQELEASSNRGGGSGLAPPSVKQAYKRLSMRFHPDRGGETADFQALGVLYDAARK